MKTSKRIWLGLGAFFIFLTSLLSVLPAQRILAASAASSQQDVIDCGNSLKFVSIAEMTCTFGGTTAHFTDPNPSDGGQNDYYKVNYQPDSSFCTTGIDGLQGSVAKYHPGVSRRGSTNAFKLSDAGQPIDIKLNVGYINSKDQCVRVSSAHQDYTIPSSRTTGIRNLLQFGSQTLDSLDAVSDGSLSGKSYDLVGDFTYNKDTVIFTDNFTPGSCSGEVVTVNISNKSAVRYNLNGDGANNDISKYPGLTAFLKAQNTAGCYVHESDTNFGLGSGSFDVTGTPPTASDIAQAPAAGSTEGGQSVNSSSDCAASSGGFSLAWVMCPIASAAVGLTDEFIGLFEDQLSFKVSDLGGTTNAASGYNQTKAGWAVIRDVASSLIVIFMLVMVLSQAVSWGPFDAYTVKKLLPKLVIATVVMQVSWDLFVWVVGLFDDLGHGIADLMYLPFGGPSNMDFWHLLGNAHISAWTMGTLDWVALAASLLAVSMAFLPAFLGLITGALMALAFGLFTLVFRKILIIMLLMVSPLALVAWILPGTSTYWKMWRENFIKALSMFPLAMGLIAAGRIFANVAGSQDGNGTFLNMIFVFVGYFGPLFILPKTFKWGGQAMQMAGNGIMKARDKANTYPQKYFKARQENWNNRNKARSYERVRNGDKWKWNKPMSYVTTPLDRFGSGQWDPLLGAKKSWGVDTPFKDKDGNKRRLGFKKDAAMRRSKVQQYKEAGHKVEEEDENLAKREASDNERRLNQQSKEEGGYNHDDYWQDQLSGSLTKYRERGYYDRDLAKWRKDTNNPTGSEEEFEKSDAYGYKDYDGHIVPVIPLREQDHHQQNAARDMLLQYGGPNHPALLANMYQEKFSNDPEKVKVIMSWAQKKAPEILKTYRQFLKGTSSTATDPDALNDHPVGVRDELARLGWDAAHETGTKKEEAELKIRQYYANAATLMRSPQKGSFKPENRALFRGAIGNEPESIEFIEGQNQEIKTKMKYEDGAVDVKGGTPHPPTFEPEVRAAIVQALRNRGSGEEDLEAIVKGLVAPGESGGYTSGTGGGGGGPAPVPPVTGRPGSERDSYPPDDTGHRYASGHPDTPRAAAQPAAASATPAASATTAAPAAPAAGTTAATVTRPATGLHPAEPEPAGESSLAAESHGSFDNPTQGGAASTRITREIRTVQGGSSTRPYVINQTGAAGQPIVQVHIDHEAIGDAVARGMRNALLHTTLKVEHPDGTPGAAGFAPKKEGEESPWEGLRPPGPSEPPAGGGAAPHE